jgi:pimeloyl-ACP methyl ester carboxylesterase
MRNARKYGKEPFRVAAIHGGPGAAGAMAPVARELSKERGILEPLQTKATLNGQVRELRSILRKNAGLPVTLVGYSWGAMLSFIFAAHYPSLVHKLILVSSGPFEEKYAAGILKTRLTRLTKKERKEAEGLLTVFTGSMKGKKGDLFARFGCLMSKADSYDVLPHKRERITCRAGIFQNVWAQAQKMRSSGELLALGEKIKCPVVAVHGDYDPHPAQGIKTPLSGVLKNFRFILLKKCGHCPWHERYARKRFYEVLRKELT